MRRIFAAFHWLLGLIIAASITIFALLNRAVVTVVWSPFHTPHEVPLFFPIILFFVMGFCLGAASMWVNNVEQRRSKNALKRQIKSFEKKLYGTSKTSLPLSGFTALSDHRKKD